MVFQGLEIDGDTEGGAYLILTAVAPTDALGVIILGQEATAELGVDLSRQRCQLLISA